MGDRGRRLASAGGGGGMPSCPLQPSAADGGPMVHLKVQAVGESGRGTGLDGRSSGPCPAVPGWVTSGVS